MQGLIVLRSLKSCHRENSFSAGTLVAGTHITALANWCRNVRCRNKLNNRWCGRGETPDVGPSW